MTDGVAQPDQNRVGLGIAMMLGAWFQFSFVDTSVKWLALLGIPALQLAFIRYLGHFLATLVAGSRAGGRASLHTSRRLFWLLVLRAGLLVSATVMNFIALKYLSLTMTATIMFSAPIIVSALSMPLLGERVGPWRWFAILLGFAGVIVVIRPFGVEFHWASLLIVYNAVALALFSILTRRLTRQVSAQLMQLHTGALGTLVLLPFAIAVWTNPSTPQDWAIFLLIGFWGWAGHELFARAHGHAEATVIMPFQYSFIIFMTAGSLVVFSEVPDRETLLGALVIVVSGLIIWWRENRGRLAHGRT